MNIRSNSAEGELLPVVLLAGCILLAMSGIGANGLLTILATTVLLVGGRLLWRPGESPILLLIFIFQRLLAAASIKWGFYWILTYAAFANPGANKKYWFLVFALELLSSMGGFFADFRTVLFFTLLAMLAMPRWSLKNYISGALVGLLL